MLRNSAKLRIQIVEKGTNAVNDQHSFRLLEDRIIGVCEGRLIAEGVQGVNDRRHGTGNSVDISGSRTVFNETRMSLPDGFE